MTAMSRYSDVTVYFSTGTGNSYRVATWMADAARAQGAEARAVQVEEADTAAQPAGDEALIGIVCPTHGFSAPWHVTKFVWRLPRAPGTHAFCCATRGGFKLGGFYGPGLSGSTTFLLAL